MSKVTRNKLKFLIYILLQETNKINRKSFQILNDFFRTHSSASRAFVTRKPCLLGKLPNPHKTLPAASGCASVPDALTAVPAIEKPGCSPPRFQKNISLTLLLFIVIIGKNFIQRNGFPAQSSAPQTNPAFPIWSCGTLHRSFSFVPRASHTLRSAR